MQQMNQVGAEPPQGVAQRRRIFLVGDGQTDLMTPPPQVIMVALGGNLVAGFLGLPGGDDQDAQASSPKWIN
jgi:hypothetical protein